MIKFLINCVTFMCQSRRRGWNDTDALGRRRDGCTDALVITVDFDLTPATLWARPAKQIQIIGVGAMPVFVQLSSGNFWREFKRLDDRLPGNGDDVQRGCLGAVNASRRALSPSACHPVVKLSQSK